MRNLYLFAGVVATTMGMAMIGTGSAFAMGCLDNQANDVPITLTHNAMSDDASGHGAKSEGFGYDKSTYDADLAKGNACPTTEQSQPMSGNGTPYTASARTAG